MTVDANNFDTINRCPKCGTPVKSPKLVYIKSKIKNITECDLEIFKLCTSCKRKGSLKYLVG